MTMTTRQRSGRRPAIWRPVRGVASALLTLHREQSLVSELRWQANRATVRGGGPLTWVLALDGYRLSGSHVSRFARRGHRRHALSRQTAMTPSAGTMSPAGIHRD